MGIYLYKGGQQLGPLDETVVVQGVRTGQFSADDMAWKEGLQEWSPLKIVLPQVTVPPAPSAPPPGKTATRPKLTLKKEVGASAQATAAQKVIAAAPMLAGAGAPDAPVQNIAPPTGPSAAAGFVGAMVGGTIAAVICGVLWALLTTTTQREFAIAAWGIGVACGFSVVLCSGGGKGAFYQVLAVAFSFLGILIGKYGWFVYSYRELINEEEGAEVAAQISFIGLGTILAFIANIGNIFGLFDLLWVGLAMASAWKIAGEHE